MVKYQAKTRMYKTSGRSKIEWVLVVTHTQHYVWLLNKDGIRYRVRRSVNETGVVYHDTLSAANEHQLSEALRERARIYGEKDRNKKLIEKLRERIK